MKVRIVGVLLAALGLITLVGAPALATQPSDNGVKVFVCKYVGTPGTNETLQTGQNPIDVSVNAIPDYQGVGSYFADAQGRSFVLGPEHAASDHVDEPDVSECPTGDVPTTTTTEVTTSTTVDSSTTTTVPLTVPSTLPDTTTTTLPQVTTTTAHDNRCDENHPNEGNDEGGHNNPDCEETTTTTSTLPSTTTSTSQPPTTTSTSGSSTTSTPPTSTSSPTPSTSGSSTTSSTAATKPGVPVLPRTGSDTAEWLLLGLLLVAAGALCLAVSRSGRTHL